MNNIIEEKLKLLPSSPGVYKMFNAAGEVIYVGKAISLKNRVRQYFQSSKNHPPKVAAMVPQNTMTKLESQLKMHHYEGFFK